MQLDVETMAGTLREVAEKTPNRPAAVIEAFVRCIESGEVQMAIGFLSSKVVSGIGYEKLEAIFSSSAFEIGSVGGIESVETRTLGFSRDHVEMQLTIWYGDHKMEDEVVELVREDGRWKVSLEEADMVAVEHL